MWVPWGLALGTGFKGSELSSGLTSLLATKRTLVSLAGMATSDRLAPFGVTIFSEMTALAAEHDAINLGQGFPNWAGAGFVKEAAARSMAGGNDDQYPPSAGIPGLRQAIADRYGPLLGRDLDPSVEITVTSGCSDALAASFLGLRFEYVDEGCANNFAFLLWVADTFELAQKKVRRINMD